MSNGPKLTMTQGLQISQTLRICIAPLMTPVLRQSPTQRPVYGDEDQTPWRDAAAAATCCYRRGTSSG
jgi:hypothetical protein